MKIRYKIRWGEGFVVSKLERVNGVLKVSIDGEIYEPLSFKSFRPTKRNISDFHSAGVRLFSILSSGLNSILKVPYSLYGESWVGMGEYDFSVVDKQIDLFMQNAPEGYFALMVQVDTRAWYLEENAGCPDSFIHLSQVAADEKWRNAAANYLKAVVSHVEEKYGDRFYGYFLLGGTTTEWFSEKDYLKTHPIKEQAYKKYLNNKNAVIPSEQVLEEIPREKVFLNKDDDKEIIEYLKFHNELISDTILFFAKEVQKILNHKKLVGVYFGYLFELLSERLWNAGSLAYEKVFVSKDIDMISSPSSYRFRNYCDTSAYMVTLATLDLHNKLYYLEFDHRTHTAPPRVGGIPFPGAKNALKDDNQSIEVMRRDFMLCAANGSALWWFDMFEGWFYSKGMMNAVKDMISIAKSISKHKIKSVAEVAVIAQGESLYKVNRRSQINNDLLSRQREGLAKMGTPYDIYSMCDLKSVYDKNYKLFIFLDAFAVSDENKKYISHIKNQGKNILWVYAADGDNTEEMSDLMGIKIKRLEEKDNTICAFDNEYGFEHFYDDMFFSDDEDADVLGVYKNSKKGGLLKKENIFFSGTGNISSSVLREIAKMSKVHIYLDNDSPVYVNNKLIGVYPHKSGEMQINTKNGLSATELFTNEKYEIKKGKLNFKALNCESKLFLIN